MEKGFFQNGLTQKVVCGSSANTADVGRNSCGFQIVFAHLMPKTLTNDG